MKKLIMMIILVLTVILTSCVFLPDNKNLDLKIKFEDNFIELSWNQIPAAEKYEIYKKNKNDENYKLIKVINSNKITKYADYDFNPHQTYIYQIMYYKNNFVSDPVEESIEIPNRLPSKVTVIFPIKDAKVSPDNVNITWNSSKDEDNDDLEYILIIKENNVVIKSDKVKDTKYTINLKYGKTYSLRIDVSDGYEIVKGDEITFKTQDPPKTLEAPQLTISSYSTSTINLQWNQINNATGYEIYRKNNDKYEFLSKTNETEYTDKNLERKKEYYYKIRAIKEENNDIIAVSDYSNEVSATTINNPPEKPELIYPSNNATGIDLNIQLKWKSLDVDGDKITYTVYFGENKNDVENKGENSKIAENLGKTEYSPTIYINKTYYWKVVATDEYGDSSESEVWSFTTKNIENAKPTLNIPDQEMSENSTLTINLSDYASDEDGDSLTFSLISGPGTIVTTDDATNYEYYADYEASGMHEVTIRVSDGYEYTDSIFEIIVTNVNRKPIILNHNVGPEAKYSGIEIKNVVLNWEVNDPDNDNLKYILYFSDDKTKVENESEDVKIVDNYESNNYNIEAVLDYQTTYYWKIIATDGDLETKSDIWMFTTKEEPAILNVEDTQIALNNSNYVNIFLSKGNDVGGFSFKFIYDPEYLEVDTSKGKNGVVWNFDEENIYFEKVTLGDNYIKINVVFNDSYSSYDGDLLKIYLKGIKVVDKTIVRFSDAYGVHDSPDGFEIDCSDIGQIKIY